MAVISIDIHIDDLPSVLALFDRIQVWRGATELGTYEEITAEAELPAILDGSIPGPWPLDGHELDITLNSADPIPVHFAGTDPLNLADTIRPINTAIPNLASEAGTGTNRLRLTSPVTGTGSSLLVAGDARAVLGFSASKVNGKAARIVVVSPTTDYLFRDFDGLTTDWYKTRYYSTLTHSVSSFSDPRQGSPQVVLPSNKLTKAQIWLADGAGRPLTNRRITFVPTAPVRVDAGAGKDYGILPGYDKPYVLTDSTGFAEIDLVRGQRFKVFFEGTDYFREFVAPNVDTFDLLQVLSTAPDPFTPVSVPPMPIRVS